jgi:hypothetical protein
MVGLASELVVLTVEVTTTGKFLQAPSTLCRKGKANEATRGRFDAVKTDCGRGEAGDRGARVIPKRSKNPKIAPKSSLNRAVQASLEMTSPGGDSERNSWKTPPGAPSSAKSG